MTDYFCGRGVKGKGLTDGFGCDGISADNVSYITTLK
jgi:hypothetical protein